MKNYFRIPTTVLLASICAYFFLSFLFLTLTSYWPGPLHDYWFEIPKIQDFFENRLSWHELVTAHANAHRLVIPRLIFIGDYVFFHGNNQLIVFISILCKFTILALLNTIIRHEKPVLKLLLNALIFATVFNAVNIPNILNSSNVQWDLMAAFSCLAVYFYSKSYRTERHNTKILFIICAYVFFICAFFSQGGSLPVIFVFVLIALLNRSWIGVISGIAFIALMFYLMAHVFPVNDEENPGMMSAIAMFIFKPKYVALFALKLLSANVYQLESYAFIFSGWSLLLLALGFYFHKKTAAFANNALLYIASFSLLMMIFIAAFRVDFAPNAWISNRYHPNVLLFILVVHLNTFLLAEVLLRDKTLWVARALVILVCSINLWVPQYFQRGTPGDFANLFFETQTKALFYGPSQTSARPLITSMQEYDKIAEADPFFRKYGFAYYANKQGNRTYTSARKPGETLLSSQQLVELASSCALNTATISYVPEKNGDAFNFSTMLNREQNSFLNALFRRDTFYAVAQNGEVNGFAYLYANPENYFSSIRIDGIVRTPSVKYIAEIKNDRIHCLYQLDNPVTP